MLLLGFILKNESFGFEIYGFFRSKFVIFGFVDGYWRNEYFVLCVGD